MAVMKTPQKFSRNIRSLFIWLSVGVLVTIIADAAVNVAHVIVSRSEHWWCGRSVVVSISGPRSGLRIYSMQR
jgi:hypothetical protein